MNPEDLFEKYLQGELSEAEGAELKRLLADEEHARRFVAYLQEWGVLAGLARQMSSVARSDGRRAMKSTGRLRVVQVPSRAPVLWWIGGVAASIVFAVGLLIVASRPAPEPVAVVEPPAPEPRVVPVPPAEVKTPEPPQVPTPEIIPDLPLPAPKPPAPAPVPDPERKPAPTPEPPRPPAEPAPKPTPAPVKPTVIAVATLDRVEGEVVLAGPEGRSRVRTGAVVPADHAVQTIGPKSVAVLKYPDATRIELGADSTIERITPSGMLLARGTLSAAVSKQPKPLVFTTPLAEATILGTHFALTVQPEFTRLDVREGRVKLARLQDGAAVEVPAGSSVLVDRAAKPQPLTLLAELQDGLGGYAGTQDTAISGADPTKTFGVEAHIEVDGDETDNKIYGLLRWDLSSIPAGAVIRGAVVTLYVSNTSQSVGYQIYEMKRPWGETEATWKSAQGGKPWRQAGARASLDRGAEPVGAVAPRARGETPILLNDHGVALVQSWVRHPATNHGIIIANDANPDGFQFESRESKTPARRPKLVVTYTPGK